MGKAKRQALRIEVLRRDAKDLTDAISGDISRLALTQEPPEQYLFTVAQVSLVRLAEVAVLVERATKELGHGR